MAAGIPYGGWCPAGGWAEDHPEPPGLLRAFPGLRATPDADPVQRTAWNVRDADATLVLTRTGARSPGTDATVREAVRRGRPYATVDVDAPDAAQRLAAFLATLAPGSALNVAGPRESEAPGLQAAARALLRTVGRGGGPAG